MKDGLSLRDIRYQMEAELARTGRGLEVRSFAVVWAKDTVYGQRLGQHPGLLITANKESVFHSSELWRSTVLHADMLQRSDMVKAAQGLKRGNYLTDVQEYKQVGGMAWLRVCVSIHTYFTQSPLQALLQVLDNKTPLQEGVPPAGRRAAYSLLKV